MLGKDVLHRRRDHTLLASGWEPVVTMESIASGDVYVRCNGNSETPRQLRDWCRSLFQIRFGMQRCRHRGFSFSTWKGPLTVASRKTSLLAS